MKGATIATGGRRNLRLKALAFKFAQNECPFSSLIKFSLMLAITLNYSWTQLYGHLLGQDVAEVAEEEGIFFGSQKVYLVSSSAVSSIPEVIWAHFCFPLFSTTSKPRRPLEFAFSDLATLES